MNSYSKDINKYVEAVKEEFKDDLALVLIIGSSCSSMVMENWSDIDSILVLKKYNFDIINRIKKIINMFSVKIGTTVFTESEFISKKIDPKVFYHLYLLENNQIELQYKREDFILPTVSFDEVKENYLMDYYHVKHELKRTFLYDKLEKEKYRAIFKKAYVIMKSILIIDGELPKNYEETFRGYSKKYNYEYFDYKKFIDDYMKDNEDYKKIYDYVAEFIFNISK